MQILISLLGFGSGFLRQYPLITGLLLFSLIGMGFSYYKGGQGARDKYKAAQAEAIKKDAKENKEILKEAHRDELEHQTEVTKSQAKLESEENEIKSLKPSQCLDVRLDAIGLR